MTLAGLLLALVAVGFAEPAAPPKPIPKTAQELFSSGAEKMNTDPRGAMVDFTKALEIQPTHEATLRLRSSLFYNEGKYRESIADLTAVLESRPGDEMALADRAYRYSLLREYDLAFADYGAVLDKAVDVERLEAWRKTWRARQYCDRGTLLLQYTRDCSAAIQDFTAALELDPASHFSRHRRGVAFHALGDYAKAEADFRMVTERDSIYPLTMNHWARQLATCPDPQFRNGKKAVEVAQTAIKHFKGINTGYHDTLAAAYAESGQFEQAIETQKQAIAMVKNPKSTAWELYRKHLALYEQRRPLREEPEAVPP